MKAGRFRHRPADLDEWGPVMDTNNNGTAEQAELRGRNAELEARAEQAEARLVTAWAERDSAVRGTAAAVRDLVARVAAVEKVLAEYGDAGPVGELAERLRAVIRRGEVGDDGD